VDDAQIETRVREAAPQTTAPLGLAEHRSRILADARRRGRGQLGAWLGGLTVFALIVGGGSAAIASGGLGTPWGWVADNAFSFQRADGTVCFQGMKIELDGMLTDSDAVREAQTILSEMDVASLDTSAAEAWARELASSRGASEETIHQLAVQRTVANLLFAELAARGIDTPDDGQSIGMYSEFTGCD
jgi:hypothetical protein